jgi:segregation and condensation protein B
MLTAPSTAPVDVLEALLFASDAPLEAERIREVLGLADVGEALALVDELRARFDTAGRALQIAEVAGGFRMVTRPEIAPWLVRLARSRTRARLSRPAVETLAIVAYRQPVSRPEIDAIRGVNSEGVLDSLLERRLVRIAGRKEAPGRPFLYETTRDFLVAFGLRDVAELPKVEGELVVRDLTGEAPAPAGEAPAHIEASVEAVPAPEGRAAAPDVMAGEDDAVAAPAAAHDPDAGHEPSDATARSEHCEAPGKRTPEADSEYAAGRAEEGNEAMRRSSASRPEGDGEDQAEQAPGAGGAHVETGR